MANVWGFPAKLGQNGGGAFLIAYLVFIVLFSLVGLSFPTANITPSRFHTSQRPPVLVTGSRFVILFQSGVKGWEAYPNPRFFSKYGKQKGWLRSNERAATKMEFSSQSHKVSMSL